MANQWRTSDSDSEDVVSSENLLASKHARGRRSRWPFFGTPWLETRFDLEHGRGPSWRERVSRSTVFSFFSKAALVLLAVWGIISLGFQTTRYIEAHRSVNCDCGSSIAEALSLGCKYDSMAAAWLPELCRDDELTAEFDRAGPGPGGRWYYWSDPYRENELTLIEMAELADSGKPFFTNWEWHVAHCFYFFRKQIRNGFTKASLGTSDPYGHIIHCEEIVKSDPTKTVMSGVGLNSSSFT